MFKLLELLCSLVHHLLGFLQAVVAFVIFGDDFIEPICMFKVEVAEEIVGQSSPIDRTPEPVFVSFFEGFE